MATVPDSQERQRTSAAIVVAAAAGYDGMRRQLEHPEIEQVDRLQRFLAGTPSALRA
jgi:hypothetical protein